MSDTQDIETDRGNEPMTRQEVLEAYSVRDGVIESLGKFEGEAIFVPAFWDSMCDEISFPDGETIYVAELTDDDRKEWPEIDPDTFALLMSESDQGFVTCEQASAERVAALQSEANAAWESETGEED
jgi:hypothetical protein